MNQEINLPPLPSALVDVETEARAYARAAVEAALASRTVPSGDDVAAAWLGLCLSSYERTESAFAESAAASAARPRSIGLQQCGKPARPHRQVHLWIASTRPVEARFAPWSDRAARFPQGHSSACPLRSVGCGVCFTLSK